MICLWLLSLSPPPFLFREMSPEGDPCNLKCPTPGKPALPAAPLVALQLSQHAPQPPRLHLSPRTLPSVRTLRLSLLQSLLAWLASPQPLERSLTTPGPPPNSPVVSSALSGAVYYGAHKSRPLPGPSPTTSQSKASGAPPRQSQSAGGALRLCPPPLPIPAAHVQGTKPVGLRPAVSSVPKAPRVVWVGSQNDIASRSSLCRRLRSPSER